MTGGVERPRDEHGRILWQANERPEVGSGLGLWRGRVVTPEAPYAGNSTRGHVRRVGPQTIDPCVDGWVESGDWWLHCAACRPYAEVDR